MKIIHFIVTALVIATTFFGYHYFFEGGDKDEPKQEQTSNQDQTEQENTSTSTGNKIYGLDISKYQRNEIDIISPKKNDLTFIIAKATGGQTYTDPDFKNNWTESNKKGFIRGAYHFYYTKDTPQSQAKHFTKTVDFKDSDLPPIVDFEGGSINTTQSVATIQDNLLTFLKSVEESTGRKPMIYTNLSVGNQYLDKKEFADYPLWIAYYSKSKNPRLPKAWKDTEWKFWQRSQSHTIDGTNNDFDLFNGSKEDLKKFVRTTE